MAGYGHDNNINHGETEYAFINFAYPKAARDAAFTELMTTNGNFSTHLTQQEDQIRVFQAKLCNLKVAAAIQNIDEKTKNTGRPYA